MKREVVIFIVAFVLSAAAAAAGAMALPDKPSAMAGLVGLPMLIVPFIMAYVCQKLSGSPVGPFKGLSWGSGGWWFAAWGLGLLCGIVCLVAAVGLGMQGIDPEMTDYLDMVRKSSGQEMPEQAMGMVRITGMVTAFAGPTLGAVFGAFVGCLSTLPFFGWLGRRLLAQGRPKAIWILIALSVISGLASGIGLVKNPAFSELSLAAILPIMALNGAAGVLPSFWIFLRTRSAIVAALFSATFQGVLQGAYVFSADANPLFAPPTGLIVPIITLMVGIGLWIWKDPGGMDMAMGEDSPDGQTFMPPLPPAPPAADAPGA